MARVNVKYPCGTEVMTKQGDVPGMVTAVFIRGKGRTYEFSYTKDGTPTCCTVEEIEIEEVDDTRPMIGF